MILQDNFYTISSIQLENDTLNATLKLNASHSIFEGHFPENPVTPGVVQMEIIKELLATHYNRPIALVSMSNCKFLAILNPTETPIVDVTISIKEEDGNLKVSATIAFEEKGYLKLAAVYK